MEFLSEQLVVNFIGFVVSFVLMRGIVRDTGAFKKYGLHSFSSLHSPQEIIGTPIHRDILTTTASSSQSAETDASPGQAA